MKTIGVFFGGRSVEHDVSIVTAQIIAKGFTALSARYRLVPIYITASGSWVSFSFGEFPSIQKIKKYRYSQSNVSLKLSPETAQLILKRSFGRRLKIDICLPLIHGTYGEDGTLQGLFEMAGVPYTGPGVLGSAVGMDKILFKDVMRANGLPIVSHLWFHRDEWRESQEGIIARIESTLSYPIFIKPSNLGSSIGITRATDRVSLEDAVEVAINYSPRVIAEQGIESDRLMEVNCAVLGYKDPIPSVLEQPLNYSEFLTFEDKYIGGGKGGSMKGLKSKVKIPAPVSDTVKDEIQSLAVKTFKLLDCAGIARVDFLVADKTKVYVNEINTIPGSLQQHLWRASGFSLSELLEKIISAAEEVAAEKNKNLTSFESSLLK